MVWFCLLRVTCCKNIFFISGLLVCNSLINNSNPIRYVISRAFRIIPALFLLLIITTLIIGPLVTSLPVTEYFSNKQVLTYFLTNLNLFTNEYHILPGVFSSNPYPSSVNGSLWTLPKEVLMYSFLLVFSMVGLVKRKVLFSILLVYIIFLPIILPLWFFEFFNSNSEVYYLPACFALGCLASLWKEQIGIGFFQLLFLFSLTLLLKSTVFYHLFFYITSFYLVLLVSDCRIFNFPKMTLDLSYGVYIYSFLIQQLVIFYLPNSNYFFNILITLLICYPAAYFSCKMIEEPSISAGRKLVARLNKPPLKAIKEA